MFVHELQYPPLLYWPVEHEELEEVVLVKVATNPLRTMLESDVNSTRIIPVYDVTLDGVDDPLYAPSPVVE